MNGILKEFCSNCNKITRHKMIYNKNDEASVVCKICGKTAIELIKKKQVGGKLK